MKHFAEFTLFNHSAFTDLIYIYKNNTIKICSQLLDRGAEKKYYAEMKYYVEKKYCQTDSILMKLAKKEYSMWNSPCQISSPG
jgi:hypothetical protein